MPKVPPSLFGILFEEYDDDIMEVIRLQILEKSKYSLLPELFDIFGKESFLKFLDIFAGHTFQVMDRKSLLRVIEDASIYTAMRRNPHAATVNYLAKRFECTNTSILHRFKKCKKVVEEQGMSMVTRPDDIVRAGEEVRDL